MNCISRLIILTVVSSGDVKSSNVRKGQRSLIVGGEEAVGDKYHYMAHIGFCGAVLIGKNVFLTAAHCETPERVVLKKGYLLSGAARRKLPGGRSWHEAKSFLVIDILNHPDWDPEDPSMAYDFRLFRVSGFPDAEPIVLDNPYSNNGYTNTNEPLTIMGWGKTGVNEPLSNNLLEADVNVLDYQTCNQAYQDYDGTKLEETLMFCAGKSSGGTYIGTCVGDSGGPAVKPDVNGKDVLVGIVSFAAGECGNSNHPTVFAKVSGVYDWINDSIKDWDCSEQLEIRERLLGAPEVPDSNLPRLVDKGSDPSDSDLPLGICEGDCDRDRDCDGELTCFDRDGDEPVPGCANGGSGDNERVDYCVQPVPDSQFVTLFEDLSCAYIMNDVTIREAVKMYLSKPNLAILVYSDPKYWVTTKVTNMKRLFYDADSFNKDISGWDVSRVTDTERMFMYATSFNKDLSQWNMSQVTITRSMFYSATSFNGDLSQWNMSKVTDTVWMFAYATSFNRDISGWDVSRVTSTEGMFEDATSFDQNLCSWSSDIQDAYTGNSKYGMFKDSGCPDASINNGNPSDTSVCHSCVPPLVDNGWSPSGSLGICEGDCDRDQDCDGGLMCFHRDGHTHVPGCENGGSGDLSHMDYCIPL